MKHYLYILVLIFACHACSPKKQAKELNTDLSNLNIRACKMYSYDFLLLDPDEKGALIQEFRFNRKGFVNELIRYDMDGEIIGRFDILGEHSPFPLPGKPIYLDTTVSVINRDSLGLIQGKEIKTYNKKGLLSEVKYFEPDGKLVKQNTYTYNRNGLIEEDIYWDLEFNKPKQKIKYEYEYFMN